MPCRFVIYKERRLVIVTVSDPVTYAEITGLQDQLLRVPDFDPEFNLLADTTAVTTLDVSSDQAKAAARRRVFRFPSKCAFVANGSLVFGMTRLAEAYSQMGEERALWHVFYDRERALKWLDLPTTR
jgi:hypothetical protein